MKMVSTRTSLLTAGFQCQNHILPFPSDESIAVPAHTKKRYCVVITSAWNTPIEHKSWTKTSDSVLSYCIQIHFQPKSAGATVKKKIESKFPRASATLKLFPCSC
jgi:hypothetical protein